MGKTIDPHSHVGEIHGIYKIVDVLDEKDKYGHWIYKGVCQECGYVKYSRIIFFKRSNVQTCTHKNLLNKEQINSWYNKNKKQCLCCGKDIPLTDLGFNEYKERKFCSQSCSVSYSNKARAIDKKEKDKNKEKKKCKNCGKELINQSRTYCSNICQHEYYARQYIEKWQNGEISGTIGNAWIDISKYIRNYLFKKYDYKCSRCGWSEINLFTNTIPLEIEHIDGDATNNKEENLTLLCPNCHSLTKTYRGANKGHGTRDIKWISRSGTTNVDKNIEG